MLGGLFDVIIVNDDVINHVPEAREPSKGFVHSVIHNLMLSVFLWSHYNWSTPLCSVYLVQCPLDLAASVAVRKRDCMRCLRAK